jgi:hypothetical protein
MRIFRWIVAIAVPLLIAFGMLVFYKDFEVGVLRGIKKSNRNLYLLVHALENAFIFFTYIILTCIFSLKPKKYGLIVAVATEGVGIILLLWFAKSRLFAINPNDILIVSLTSMIAGLALGVVASLALFKNRGWDVIKEVEPEPAEQY